MSDSRKAFERYMEEASAGEWRELLDEPQILVRWKTWQASWQARARDDRARDAEVAELRDILDGAVRAMEQAEAREDVLREALETIVQGSNAWDTFAKEALAANPTSDRVELDINGHEVESAVDNAWENNAVDFLGVEERSMTYREFVAAGYEIAKALLQRKGGL